MSRGQVVLPVLTGSEAAENRLKGMPNPDQFEANFTPEEYATAAFHD